MEGILVSLRSLGPLRRLSSSSIRYGRLPRHGISPQADTDVDQSVIPAGVDLSAYFRDKSGKDLTRFRSLRLQGEVSDLVFPDSSHYVYAYNLPFHVNEDVIRNALAGSIGTPDAISIYDMRGTLAPKHPILPKNLNEFHLASPMNALLHFPKAEAYNKACLIENKLFGVLCKYSVTKSKQSEKSRMMFLEPADGKRTLLFSGFPRNTSLETFKNLLEGRLRKMGIGGNLSMPPESMKSDVCIAGTIVSLILPSFNMALHAFKAFREDRLLPSVLPSFVCVRTRWNSKAQIFLDYNGLPRVFDPCRV